LLERHQSRSQLYRSHRVGAFRERGTSIVTVVAVKRNLLRLVATISHSFASRLRQPFRLPASQFL